MAFNPSRSGLSISRRVLQQCKPTTSSFQPFSSTTPRSFSQSLARHQDTAATQAIQDAIAGTPENAEANDLPRWAHTPDRMKSPFSLAIPRSSDRPVWKVNEDPRVLDEFYNRFLGRDGQRMLPEELKWLAVTHKSFDQGRRGFNTRLAHFGRHILIMEAIRYIMASPASSPPVAEPNSLRKPFEHPALANVDKLTMVQPLDLVSKDRVTKLALDLRLNDVVRWEPRDPLRLNASGLHVVLHSAVYAILGAVSLQHGAESATRICKERVLSKLDA